jgi:hypothetical protein
MRLEEANKYITFLSLLVELVDIQPLGGYLCIAFFKHFGLVDNMDISFKENLLRLT